MVDKINKEIQNMPETIFDQYDIKIDTRKSGAALRSDLADLVNLYGTISTMASKASLAYGKAEARRDKVESMAWSKVSPDLKVSQQKMLVRDIPVQIDGEETNLAIENENLVYYEYVSNCGKHKVKEISTLLDMGRSLLSWDKQEAEKL